MLTHAEGYGGAQDLGRGVRPRMLHLLPLLRRERCVVVRHPHIAAVVVPQRMLRSEEQESSECKVPLYRPPCRHG